jgi:hypothetical protein
VTRKQPVPGCTKRPCWSNVWRVHALTAQLVAASAAAEQSAAQLAELAEAAAAGASAWLSNQQSRPHRRRADRQHTGNQADACWRLGKQTEQHEQLALCAPRMTARWPCKQQSTSAGDRCDAASPAAVSAELERVDRSTGRAQGTGDSGQRTGRIEQRLQHARLQRQYSKTKAAEDSNKQVKAMERAASHQSPSSRTCSSARCSSRATAADRPRHRRPRLREAVHVQG